MVQWCHVRTTDETSQNYEAKTGIREGCTLSPVLFKLLMDRNLKEEAETLGGALHANYSNGRGSSPTRTRLEP